MIDDREAGSLSHDQSRAAGLRLEGSLARGMTKRDWSVADETLSS